MTGRRQDHHAPAHAEPDDTHLRGAESGRHQVVDGGRNIGFETLDAQCTEVRHDVLHVVVGDYRVPAAMEEVGGNRVEADVRKPPADVFDVLGDPKRLLDDDDRTASLAIRL
jgi:hypothetical protein